MKLSLGLRWLLDLSVLLIFFTSFPYRLYESLWILPMTLVMTALFTLSATYERLHLLNWTMWLIQGTLTSTPGREVWLVMAWKTSATLLSCSGINMYCNGSNMLGWGVSVAFLPLSTCGLGDLTTGCRVFKPGDPSPLNIVVLVRFRHPRCLLRIHRVHGLVFSWLNTTHYMYSSPLLLAPIVSVWNNYCWSELISFNYVHWSDVLQDRTRKLTSRVDPMNSPSMPKSVKIMTSISQVVYISVC